MSGPGILDALDDEERATLRPAPVPDHAAAMKAVLTTERFDDPNWVYERKLDGIRCIAVRSGPHTRLLSRNDLSMNARYPEIAAALDAEPCERFAVDGEVVAFEGARTSFARLAQRPVAVFYYVFDVLWLEGYDVRPLTLRACKRLLRSALTFKDGVRLTPHRNEHGNALFEEACRKGWEGLIAKRADSPYTATRSRDWLKFAGRAPRSAPLTLVSSRARSSLPAPESRLVGLQVGVIGRVEQLEREPASALVADCSTRLGVAHRRSLVKQAHADQQDRAVVEDSFKGRACSDLDLTAMPPRSQRTAILYVRGLSTGDFKPTLEQLLGEDAAGLSPTTIDRMWNEWEEQSRRREVQGRHPGSQTTTHTTTMR